ncbi:MAG: molecular chaperone Hsp33 [Alphaproteobacteria bacterium]|nr:molecular chaperone Hsp33 [Alphaproteobacteria bacterium]
MDDTRAVPATDDLVQPFQLDTLAARGRLVRLGPVLDRILGYHDYPPPVARLLAEALVLAAVMSDVFKYDGIFTLQAKGDGLIRLLVADVTTDGGMRGYVQFDRDRLAALAIADAGADAGDAEASVPRLLGSGYLAFTVDQGAEMERYQGIVDLDGATLADCAHRYFRQSQQLEAVVKLAVARAQGGDGRWRAGAIMVQRIGRQGIQGIAGAPVDEEAEDGWRRAVILMGSATTAELADLALHPHRLLYRLFHEDGVRVFDPALLRMECRCTPERVRTMLRSFPRRELDEFLIDDALEVTCEFCSQKYRFDVATLDGLYCV